MIITPLENDFGPVMVTPLVLSQIQVRASDVTGDGTFGPGGTLAN